MTSQESNTTIGNMNMSRIFNVTATDGQYNNADDTITSTSIGLSIPNQTITFVASTYAAGCSVWRIISSTTNTIKRQGFASQTAYSTQAECAIAPYVVQPDDLFQVYTQIVDATPNQANVLALVQSSRGVEAFSANGVIDATYTALTSLVSGLGLGNLLFGSTVTNVAVQVEDNGALGSIQFVDAASGTQYTGYGAHRSPDAGGLSMLTNGVFPVSIPVQKGWVLNVKTTSA